MTELEVRVVEGKGRGVFTKKEIKKHEYICMYPGELLGGREGDERFISYPENKGSYLFFFTFMGKRYCLDATTVGLSEFGRYINHSKKNQNVRPTVAASRHGVPCLYFVAMANIPAETELLYDYGERNKMVLEQFPWLRK